MCGIVGWVLTQDRAPAAELLSGLLDRIAHRGPDSSGTWFGTCAQGVYQVALGHRRLAIIDLSPGGAQPMAGKAGDQIIYNGEIYNYLELRAELEALGERFASNSDTEVLLRLLEREGAAALPRLRGMFAFAWWNPAREELMLARDHFGKKPLYVAQMGEGIVFGSELQALTEMHGLDRTIDLQAVPEYLRYRYVPGPNTFFKAVKKLPPGHVAFWRNGTLKTERYFEPPGRRPQARNMSLDQAADELLSALREAVALRLRSDAPFGAFLSGGLDSATVVALMTERLQSPVKTFAAGFEEKEHSEFAFAALVARHFSTDHHEVIVPARAVIELLPKAILHRGAPVSEPSDIPIMMLSQSAGASVKMVLTGEGSDEFLAGYPKHKFDPLVERYQNIVPAALHAAAERLAKRMPSAGRRFEIVFRAAQRRDFRDRVAEWFAVATEDKVAGLLRTAIDGRSQDAFPFSSEGTNLKRMLFFDQTSWLPDNLLERGDRMMMAGSIEGRMPFMDIGFAKVASTIPDHLLAGGRGGKRALRHAVAGLLPEAVLHRKKVGFKVPISHWFRSSLREYLWDHLTGPTSATSAIFDRRAIERVLSEHASGRRDHGTLLWTLLNLEIFMATYKLG